ncbi:MAG: ATP-binding protein [Caulobacter sp.]|nr:ATP-binding protein [Caulobacter sp.]
MNERVKDPITDDAVLVGSYSLETLTTGMYENPLHCIREYIQNAYDAIRAARGHGLSDVGGLVTVSISGTAARPTLSVKDDGTGIPEAEAVRTLVSIGASKKRPNINAGFRGIGRLAGVAYCTTLRFTTSAQGESIATVVEFDCGRMRGFMRPGADVLDVREVLRACVKTGTIPADPTKHFTEVEMIGLIGVGLEFVEIERLVPYLRQVSPVDFSDRFTPAPRIRAFTESLGHPIGTVEVETRYKKERTQILKAYDNSTPISGGKASTIHDVELITSPDKGWHGWIGLSNFKGELTDDTVAGVRFRLKNIQVGGSEIIEELGSELTVGGTEGRLQRWAVGEVFITEPSVVPNARRDGFEDSPAWRAIKKDIKTRVARRIVTLVRGASTSRKTLKTIAAETSQVASSLQREFIDPAVADRVAATIERLLGRLSPEKLFGGEPNEVAERIAKLKELRDRLVELRARKKPEPEQNPETGPDSGTGAESGAGDPPGTGSSSGAPEKEPGDGVEPGRDEPGPDDTNGDPADEPTWTAEELYDAVYQAMVEQLGQGEADRIVQRAREILEEG